MALTATANTTLDRFDLVLTSWTASAPTIYRVPVITNTPTAVRNAAPATIVSNGWTGYDAEAPHGIPVYYFASNGVVSVVSTAVTLPAATGTTTRTIWLKHLTNTSLYVQLSLVEVPSFSIPSKSTLLEPIGRTNGIAISSPRGAVTGSVTVRTSTYADWTTLRALLADGSALLLQSPTNYYFGGDVYVQIGDIDESPLVAKAGYDCRRFTLPFTVVSSPSSSGLFTSYSWDRLGSDFNSWDQLQAYGSSWDAISLGPQVNPTGAGP